MALYRTCNVRIVHVHLFCLTFFPAPTLLGMPLSLLYSSATIEAVRQLATIWNWFAAPSLAEGSTYKSSSMWGHVPAVERY